MEKIHAGKSWREMIGGVFLALRRVVGKLGSLIVFLYRTGVFVWASQQLTRSKAQRSPSEISLSSLWHIACQSRRVNLGPDLTYDEGKKKPCLTVRKVERNENSARYCVFMAGRSCQSFENLSRNCTVRSSFAHFFRPLQSFKPSNMATIATYKVPKVENENNVGWQEPASSWRSSYSH